MKKLMLIILAVVMIATVALAVGLQDITIKTNATDAENEVAGQLARELSQLKQEYQIIDDARAASAELYAIQLRTKQAEINEKESEYINSLK